MPPRHCCRNCKNAPASAFSSAKITLWRTSPARYIGSIRRTKEILKIGVSGGTFFATFPPVPHLISGDTIMTEQLTEKISKTDAEWKRQLTPEQYQVARACGTEPAFPGQDRT